MIGIVIVAHGGLATELLAALEHVIGEQPGIRAIAVKRDHEREATRSEICATADAVDTGSGVVVVVDLHGGSPANLSEKSCQRENRRMLYGANLAMLIKLARSRDKSVHDAAAHALDAARKYIGSQNITVQQGQS